ncbi:MAG: YbaY family lipoprotein [Vogesella sp.]|uniref:YbaY family lipoprotein n=1 Tax=Vogesella sp. TaxID=1904252 RepID=UPI003918F2C6
MNPTTRRTLLLGLAAGSLAACATRPGMGYVNGSAFYMERIAYPRDKTLLRVRLLDVSSGVPAVLAEQTLEKVATPIAFSLCYDYAAITTGRQYAVDARLFVDGELRMQAAEPVANLANKVNLRLVMVGQ